MKTPFSHALPDDPTELEKFIRQQEQSFAPFKKGNEAKIIWANDSKKKTKYSIVYFHGFTASHGEGDPWHASVARDFSCNLYLPRLHGHGLKRENFLKDFNYPDLLTSAINACLVGRKLGENVLLMGTSTGGALALYAARSGNCPIQITALMLASPLIHFYGLHSLFLENKVGRFFAKIIRGKDYKYNLNSGLSPDEEQIWYPHTPLNAAMELGKMVQHVMKPSLLSNITCPVFTGYYFKNARFHDRVVSPRAILKMVEQLGTPENKKRIVNFPDAETHVIGSGLLSKAVPALIAETTVFLENVVGLTPQYSS